MNTKLAKSLRASIKYHPSHPRRYVYEERTTRKHKNGVITGTIELDPACSRSLYQQMKKELR